MNSCFSFDCIVLRLEAFAHATSCLHYRQALSSNRPLLCFRQHCEPLGKDLVAKRDDLLFAHGRQCHRILRPQFLTKNLSSHAFFQLSKSAAFGVQWARMSGITSI